MNKKLMMIIIISFAVFTSAWGKVQVKYPVSNIISSQGNTDAQSNKSLKNNVVVYAEENNGGNNNSKANLSYKIINETYTNNNIKINYPQITNLKNLAKEKSINELLKREALRDFDPEQDTVDISSVIKLQNANVLSIQYSGYRNTKNTPHPTIEFYTTNIDMNKGSKLRLSDFIKVDESFVKKFREGLFIDWEGSIDSPATEERKTAVAAELNNLTTDDLIKYFNECDNVGEANTSNTYCYLTKDSIGISVNVSHPIGDHAEFEIQYKDIMDNINNKNIIAENQ